MRQSPKNILIIEDDQTLQDALKEKLIMIGYTVSTAPNGEIGLSRALFDHPDLIILDILMPKIDGLQVLEKLRTDEWGKSAPVIIFTNVDPDDKTLFQVIKDHPTYYLIKSNASLEELAEKVDTIFDPQSSV